jgi:predicted permease
MYVLNSLLPVFLLIALGKALTRTSFFTPDLARNVNRLTYWVALPALLIDKISNASFNSEEVSRISIILILATLLSIGVAYVVGTLLRIERKSMGAFVQGSVRANNAFVGLPVILYAMSGMRPGLEAVATVALAPAIIVYNIISITVLLAHGDKQKHNTADTVKIYARQLLTNPLIIACVIGLALNAARLLPPLPIQRSLTALGNMALGLALLSIGTSLSFEGIRNGLGRSLTASCIQVFVQPLIGLALALLWKLPAIDRQMLLIYLACPAAVASYVLADIFNSDRELAGHIIVVSTLLSAISLTLIIAFGG